MFFSAARQAWVICGIGKVAKSCAKRKRGRNEAAISNEFESSIHERA